LKSRAKLALVLLSISCASSFLKADRRQSRMNPATPGNGRWEINLAATAARSPELLKGLTVNQGCFLSSSVERSSMAGWFWYALVAAILYGAHQIFTKLASDRISDGLGGFVVEATAAMTILLYLIYLRFSGRWNQAASVPGINYSILTGLCVGAGTVVFFLLFQKGGPLSAVPAILAVGAAMMAVAGICFFKEPASPLRLFGVVLSIVGLLLLRR